MGEHEAERLKAEVERALSFHDDEVRAGLDHFTAVRSWAEFARALLDQLAAKQQEIARLKTEWADSRRHGNVFLDALCKRLGRMADAVVSAKTGPGGRFFTRATADEIALLLREAEKFVLEREQEAR